MTSAVIGRISAGAARTVCGAVGLGLAVSVVVATPAILLPEMATWFRAGGLWVTLAAGAAGLGLARIGWPPGRILVAIPPRIFAALAFAVALGTGIWACFAVQKGVPDVPDELSYLHQARGFADGELAPASPPLEEFHYTSWAIHDGGRWYSVFPPGYGVLLAAGVKAGAPWLVNPILGALLALALFALGRDIFGGDGIGARAAVLVYLGSWFRMMHAGSFMAHPTATLFTILAALGVLRGVTAGGSWRWGAVAGASGAALLATRPLNAVLLAVALLPFVVRAFAERAPLKRAIPVLAAALPILVGYGLYNRALTGSALLPPQQRYMELKEEVGDCFRVGFGPGVGQCPITQSTSFGRDGFQPRDAAQNTVRRFDAFLRYSFGFAALAALPALGALAGAFGGAAEARRRSLAATMILVTVVGYGLFFYHGVAYGARFYYESFPFAALLSAAGLLDLERVVPARVRPALSAGTLALIVTGLWAAFPAVEKHAGQRTRTQDGALLEILRAPALRDAVVFVDSQVIPAAMTLHPGDIDANHPIVVRDFGDEADAGYLRVHPRPGFRLVGRRAVPLHPPAGAPIRNEGGALYPLERSVDGFGDRVAADQAFRLPLSNGQALRFRGRAANARFEFPTFTVDAGATVLHVAVVAWPQGPRAQISVDGQPISGWIDTSAGAPALRTFDLPATLSPGRHWIGVTLATAGTFFLDHVELGRP